MFDDILGDVNEQQEKIESKLREMEILKKSEHGEVEIIVNAKKDIVDITINKQFEDNAELEDLLVLTIKEAMKEADRIAAEETQNLLNSIMPGGLSGLFGG